MLGLAPDYDHLTVTDWGGMSCMVLAAKQAEWGKNTPS